MTSYTMRIETSLPHDAAVERTRAALVSLGFGVLTEIDVRATMRAKVDLDMRGELILGA